MRKEAIAAWYLSNGGWGGGGSQANKVLRHEDEWGVGI